MEKKKRKHKKHKPHVNHKAMTIGRCYKTGFLSKMDKRTEIYADLRNNFDELCDDLGGSDSLSLVQRTLIERFTFFKHMLEQLEQELIIDFLEGKSIDKETLAKYTMANNSLQGIITKLGIQRKAHPTINLTDYVSKKKKRRSI